MPLSIIFSLIFLFAFAVYILLGLYALSLNPKNIMNRLFFTFCIVLCIWTFGYSIAASASDYETALLFHRISSVGWCGLFGLQLHFIIILIGKKRILQANPWLYLLLYLPGLVALYPFGINGKLAENLYVLVNTTVGWVNMYPLNGWNLYFVTYFVSYTIASILLLFKGAKDSNDPATKIITLILGIAYSLALLIAVLTEVIINSHTSFIISQMAPVAVLMPVTVIYYAIRKYGFMGPAKIQVTETGRILNEVNLVKYYQNISLAFILGSILGFACLYYFNHEPLTSTLMFSSMLFLFGIIIQMLSFLPPKNNLRENIFTPLLALSVPLISLGFLDTAAAVVWAIPAIMVVMSVVFNKRRMMLLLGISIILTQIWVWIKAPAVTVNVAGADHFARLGIFILLLWLANFVNRVYIQRLEENEAQIGFQKIVSQISASFVNLNEANIAEKVKEMLRLSGEYFQADRAYFFSLSPNLKTFEWCNENIESSCKSILKITAEDFPWWMDQMMKKSVLNIINVEDMPAESTEEKALCRKHNIQSLVSMPVTYKDKILGNLFFASEKKSLIWREDHKELLQILANLLRDALVKVETENEISYLAFYDGLTGLPNRTLFKNRLEQAIHLAKRTEKFIGIVFIDLDSFKAVNDSIGHDGGDEILKQVALRLTSCLRKQDTVTRFGGDEFLIMVTQLERTEDIHKVTENIMKTFLQPFAVNQQEFFISVSAGIAVYPEDGEDADTLTKNADLAMYTSKDRGKNQFTLCSPFMKDDVLANMRLTNNLYRALEKNELSLHYQPQVSSLTQSIVGIEALLRWNHPELGAISPVTFIPIAERTGLIKPIGQWVLHTACSQGKLWQDLGLPPIRIAVNLSADQFHNSDLVSIVANTLKETGLEARYLELEITESAAVNESANVTEVLHKLKELGVTIAIDDFGINHSSLNRLKTLPVDRLKIDRQFVFGIEEGSKDEAIAKTIIQLAKNLKLKVIAEGVETELQYKFFTEQMCDEIQGYYFGRPMPANELESILVNKAAIN
ncbi:MAG TPA: EAL domain-containing protein [Syntrophomonadaceae bacterium]|nr:EAL domain-containing protein [Syntrophomonadaceae bacterium]HPR94335.1 EAL domain-containing protein [Syntrophomonadaceae bacterium]